LVDAQTVGVLVTGASVTVAAIYYVMNIRISQRNQELSLKALEQSAKTQELQLKAQEQNLETRQAQLFMQLFDRFSGTELSMDYGKLRYDICPKCHDNPEEFGEYVTREINDHFNPEVFLPVHQFALFFEGVSVLAQKRLIDMDMVDRLFADRIVWYWNMAKPRILQDRKVQGPELLSNFEWLANQMAGKYTARTQSGQILQ
jgi:hypothetical protein